MILQKELEKASEQIRIASTQQATRLYDQSITDYKKAIEKISTLWEDLNSKELLGQGNSILQEEGSDTKKKWDEIINSNDNGLWSDKAMESIKRAIEDNEIEQIWHERIEIPYKTVNMMREALNETIDFCKENNIPLSNEGFTPRVYWQDLQKYYKGQGYSENQATLEAMSRTDAQIMQTFKKACKYADFWLDQAQKYLNRKNDGYPKISETVLEEIATALENVQFTSPSENLLKRNRRQKRSNED